jgi:hypothetical protein
MMMGFTEVLTIVFVVLKLVGVIDWNWFLVLLPEIIALVFYGLMMMSLFGFAFKVAMEEVKAKRGHGRKF